MLTNTGLNWLLKLASMGLLGVIPRCPALKKLFPQYDSAHLNSMNVNYGIWVNFDFRFPNPDCMLRVRLMSWVSQGPSITGDVIILKYAITL